MAVVLITGASSGIGRACAVRFAKRGDSLVLAARRVAQLESLAATLRQEHQAKVCVVALNVRDKDQVNEVIQSLVSPFDAVDILVNNAGVGLTNDAIQDASTSDWDAMIDTNIKGVLYATRRILPGMIKRGRGHIVNIGSISSHEVYPGGAVYCATKHAVKAITKGLRLDLLGEPIRVSSVDPGQVHTEFCAVRWQDEQRAEAFYRSFKPLKAEDIADCVCFCVSAPAHMNVEQMVVMPTCQASANHLVRENHQQINGIGGAHHEP